MSESDSTGLVSPPREHSLENYPKNNQLQNTRLKRSGKTKSKNKRNRNVSKEGNLICQQKTESSQNVHKQTLLTSMWNKNSNTMSAKDMKIMAATDLFKKTLEDQIAEKNAKINKLKQETKNVTQKFVELQHDSREYKEKAKQIIRQALLRQSKQKMQQRAKLIPEYGYFDEGSRGFINGPYLKGVQQKVKEYTAMLQELKNGNRKSANKQNKQTLNFQQTFLKKKLQQQTDELKKRQQKVQKYKQTLKFSRAEAECYYARLDWPTIGTRQDPDRFQTLELLGGGGFGSVYLCYDLNENNYVAIKQNKFQLTFGCKNDENKQNYLKHIRRQAQIQKNLRHPNIAKLIQILKMDQNQVNFVMQYCEGPQLGKYLKQNKTIQQKQAKQIIRQVVCAVKYLSQQQNRIIHYDLKPSNIMFHHGIVKIVDFGLCKQMDSDQTRIDITSLGMGTYYYLPPETFREEEVSSKVDIWSIGVILYEMLYGIKPYGHKMSQQQVSMHRIIADAKNVQFPPQTKHKVSEGAKKFIRECLAIKQDDRLSPEEAFNHEYFN